MAADTDLNRLVFETVRHDFVVDQVQAYLDAGVQLFHPMPEAKLALWVSGVILSDNGLRISFADTNIPAKSIDAPNAVEIYVLRP